MNLRRTATLAGLAVCLATATGTSAQAQVVDARDLDERLKRIERLIATEGLIKLFEEVESQRIEIRELRGQLEEQAHAIEQLEQRQRELYLDVDERLQRMESAPVAAEAALPSPQPATTETAATPTVSTDSTGAPASQPAASPAPATTPTTPTTPTATSGIDPFAEQQAYQSAFELLKSGRYEEATVAFEQFVADYPGGSYADNAQYWLGETYYITRRFEEAIREFERLVTLHPGSQKLTHALLKLGYSHDELGNEAEAARVLGDLIARHPQSAAAGLARKRLVAIRQ